MITVRKARAAKTAMLLCAAVLLGLTGCSREQQDWRAAERADTLESYGQFIEHHPESELTTQARERITQLGEDRDWQQAGAAHTAEAYRQFLAQHPIGKWSQEARIRIESFSLGAQPIASGAAPAPITAAAPVAASAPVPTPIAAPPTVAAAAPVSAPASTSAPAPAVPPVRIAMRPGAGVAGSSTPAVQLGAFSSQGAASSEWKQLSARFAPELRGLSPTVVPASTASGRLFRLQVKVVDEAHARALCDTLRKRSQACVPLIPH